MSCKKYLVKQYDSTDCAAACLATVCMYYKKESTISKFIKILLPQKKLFLGSIITSIILTILGIGSAFFNKILMDEILPYGLKNQLMVFAIGFMVIGITQILITAIRQHMLLYLSQKIDIPLLLGYFKHVYRLPSKFFATRKVGDVIMVQELH